jgi:hypothetical protein
MSTSCTLVLRIFPENTTFQTEVVNLGLETGTIFKGNFSLQGMGTKEYFLIPSVIYLYQQKGGNNHGKKRRGKMDC